jgi:preprotein translocase subunit SecG
MVLYYLFSTFYVVTCLILLLVILLQQGKGDMAAAFGGGSSQSAFGARAGATVLSKATAILAVLFMVGAMICRWSASRGPDSVSAGRPAPPAPITATPRRDYHTPGGDHSAGNDSPGHDSAGNQSPHAQPPPIARSVCAGLQACPS